MFLRTVELAFARFQKKRDGKALAIVFDRTAPELLRVARHLAREPGDAEDLVQATFLTAIEAADTHERGKPVLPWLLGILSNQARAHRRRLRRRPDPTRVRADVVADVDDEVARNELERELAVAIDDLPAAYRPVLRLWFEHGLEAQEIAATLERPAGTVRSQVSRGIEMLRQRLPEGLAGVGAVAVSVAASRSALAAIRSKVLGHPTLHVAGASSGIGSALVLGGLLMLHHKLLALGAVAAVAVLSWLSFVPPGEVAPNEVIASGPPAVAAGNVGASQNRDVVPAGIERDAVEVPKEPPEDEGETLATKPTTLVVQIVDGKTGAPLAGYGLATRRPGEISNLNRSSVLSRSDRNGKIWFERIAPGSWWLELDRANIVGVAEVREGQVNEHTVSLEDLGVVTGVVVDQSGRPIPDADIVLQGRGMTAPTLATSDALGQFEIRHVRGGELQARKPGYAPSFVEGVQGQPGGQTEIQLQLRAAGGTLTGRVLDVDGSPLADAGVAIARVEHIGLEITQIDGPQPRPLWVRTDEAGMFRTDELDVGEHIVVARGLGENVTPASQRVQVTTMGTHVDLQCAQPAVIEGALDLGGEAMPREGVRVTVWTEEPTEDLGYLVNLFGLRNQVLDPDGRFRIVGVLPGRVQVTAFRGAQSIGQQMHTIAAGQTVRCDFALGGGSAAVKVQLQLPAGSKAAPTLMAMVYHSATPNGPPGMVPFQDGRATVQCSTTGPSSIVVTELRGRRNIVQLARAQVQPGERKVTIEIGEDQLPTRHVRGRIVDSQHAPQQGVTVAVRRMATDGLISVLEGATGADGTFDLGPLPTGQYAVLVGELRSAKAVGQAVLTSARDEDVGDLVVAQ